MTEVKVVEVKIIGKSFKIKCSEDECPDLYEAVDYVNKFLSKINNKSVSNQKNNEKLIILLALNLYQEVLQLKRRNKEMESFFSNYLTNLESKMDQVLSE